MMIKLHEAIIFDTHLIKSLDIDIYEEIKNNPGMYLNKLSKALGLSIFLTKNINIGFTKDLQNITDQDILDFIKKDPS